MKVFCARVHCEFARGILNFELFYFLREAVAFFYHNIGGPDKSIQVDKCENRVSQGRLYVVLLLGARAHVFEDADSAGVCPREIQKLLAHVTHEFV